MHVSGFGLQRPAARRAAVIGIGMLSLALGACHDRNPTTQQPYGPSVPSTSPTSTTPRQSPAGGSSVLSPAKPASTTPTVPSSRSSS